MPLLDRIVALTAIGVMVALVSTSIRAQSATESCVPNATNMRLRIYFVPSEERQDDAGLKGELQDRYFGLRNDIPSLSEEEFTYLNDIRVMTYNEEIDSVSEYIEFFKRERDALQTIKIEVDTIRDRLNYRLQNYLGRCDAATNCLFRQSLGDPPMENREAVTDYSLSLALHALSVDVKDTCPDLADKLEDAAVELLSKFSADQAPNDLCRLLTSMEADLSNVESCRNE